ELRRQLYREASGPLEKNVLKGTRWLLLKNQDNLNDNHGESARLQEALALNKPLATAYYLKESLKELWNQQTKQQAANLLNSWCRQAESSGVMILQKFAKTLQGFRSGILVWYDHPISTGPLEGLNNKIKTLKRTAYGYRNQEYFKLKILAIHQAKHA
ncbi:MAG: transposase, partial [Planctomycetaceae bacterium]|nr:transposase [Planctomycetaceae bacterium]